MPELRHCIDELVPVGMRLDRYVAEIMRLLSRSQIKARALEGTINGKKVKLSRVVKQGDILDLQWQEAQPIELMPEDIPLNIIYEDECAVVVNKPQGMVVHPGAGNRRGTLANVLYFRRLQRSNTNGDNSAVQGLRPGIVHRLDKDTSGVIIAAYDDEALAFLADQFKSRTVKKTYVAIVNGKLPEQKGRISTFIARDPGNRKRFAVANKGKAALTLYRVIKTWSKYSLVLLRPCTGRTHQLRVHLRHLGNPIVGDPLYGGLKDNFPDATLMLHAKSLRITLPGETAPRTFRAPLPDRFKEMIHYLNG